MLETIWYALVLMLQALNGEPALANKDLRIDVYLQSKLEYRLELAGTITEGSFYERLKKQPYGDFELMRKATRQFAISPLQLPPENTEMESTSNTSQEKPTSAPSKSALKELPTPFFVDLATAMRSMKDFSRQNPQFFPYTAPETSTEKPDSQAASSIRLEKHQNYWVLSNPEADMILVLYYE
jgi:hypothetical protein